MKGLVAGAAPTKGGVLTTGWNGASGGAGGCVFTNVWNGASGGAAQRGGAGTAES